MWLVCRQAWEKWTNRFPFQALISVTDFTALPFTAQRRTVQAAFLNKLPPVQPMPRPLLLIRAINDVLY